MRGLALEAVGNDQLDSHAQHIGNLANSAPAPFVDANDKCPDANRKGMHRLVVVGKNHSKSPPHAGRATAFVPTAKSIAALSAKLTSAAKCQRATWTLRVPSRNHRGSLIGRSSQAQ